MIRSMYKDEIIKRLQDENEQLRRENKSLKERVNEIELLKEHIRELESRLAKYENAHTPPSLRRDRSRKKGQNEGEKGKPGQKSQV